MKKRKVKKDLSKDCKKDLSMGCGKGFDCCKGGGFYFLGFLGAVIYYLQTSTSFWNGVLGILKAIVWPVFVVIKLLGL
jgi:hypothetical protein